MYYVHIQHGAGDVHGIYNNLKAAQDVCIYDWGEWAGVDDMSWSELNWDVFDDVNTGFLKIGRSWDTNGDLRYLCVIRYLSINKLADFFIRDFYEDNDDVLH